MNVRELLRMVVEQKASDLHITVGVPPTVRLNGELTPLNLPTLGPQESKDMVMSLFGDKQHLGALLEEKGEVDFSFGMNDLGRFRVNAYKQRGSYAAAVRTVSGDIPTMEELGLPKTILERLCSDRKGLILITGPTGSGKSTTLATMIDYMNRVRRDHIITLEDPIEYLHRHRGCIVNQREIGLDTHSYADALRAVLREDPDVILVGEMRDLETISTAITAAETGHLVLSTLHTIGAAQTIDRIIDVFPPHQQQQIRVQLANILKGVVSQQLLPRKDRKGRVAAFEIMLSNPAISNLIRDEKIFQIYSQIQMGALAGMMTMEASVARLCKEGKVAIEVGNQYVQMKDEFKRLAGK